MEPVHPPLEEKLVNENMHPPLEEKLLNENRKTGRVTSDMPYMFSRLQFRFF